jgi:hypothetical protein
MEITKEQITDKIHSLDYIYSEVFSQKETELQISEEAYKALHSTPIQKAVSVVEMEGFTLEGYNLEESAEDDTEIRRAITINVNPKLKGLEVNFIVKEN